MRKSIAILAIILSVVAITFCFAALKDVLTFTLSGAGLDSQVLTTKAGRVAFAQFVFDSSTTGNVQLVWTRQSKPAVIFSDFFTNVTDVTWLPESDIHIMPGETLSVSNTAPTALTAWVGIGN